LLIFPNFKGDSYLLIWSMTETLLSPYSAFLDIANFFKDETLIEESCVGLLLAVVAYFLFLSLSLSSISLSCL